MIATIEITCETEDDLQQHLDTIKAQIHLRARENPDHTFDVGTHFSFQSMIGDHEVTITNDK